MSDTVTMTTADAIVSWMVAQRTVIDGEDAPLFPGVFAIFGHGNVTCLGHALQRAGDALPTWRGQNEQGMAHAAVAFSKATRRRQIMAATSSIGPGALNMVTAAGAAMANRLPLLLLAGDTFASRLPDPVLQQVEHPGAPSTTVNDAFRAVVRYWDRITRPDQLVSSLPQALRTLTDPSECGPVLLALPQDVQAEAWDFPRTFFEVTVTVPPRPRADADEIARAAQVLAGARRPLIVAGGGVHYALAEEALADFARAHFLPVVETVAGKSCLNADHPMWSGPIGVTGWDASNQLACESDVVLAVGTRLGDFTTGSWTVFGTGDTRIIGVNTSRFDAIKHGSCAVVGDAGACLGELTGALGDWRAPEDWVTRAATLAADGTAAIAKRTVPVEGSATYAQVIGAVNRCAGPEDYVVAAAGGLPGELNVNWLSRGTATFDCEYGFSTMGYEISGGWGAAMARAGSGGDVFVFVGDGSYLMMNSDLYSSVLSGHRMVVIVCDNGGYAVIERLQVAQGGVPFTNMISTSRVVEPVRVDFAAHAAAMGCNVETVASVEELEDAVSRARAADRTTAIVIATEPQAWSDGGAFWEVGVPAVSSDPAVTRARVAMDAARRDQWIRG